MVDARFPCIVRSCGEHFDVINISMNVVDESIEVDSPWTAKPPKILTWEDLRPLLASTSRQMTMVWDWETASHEQSVHHDLFRMVDYNNSFQQPSHDARILSYAQIMEDLGPRIVFKSSHG